MINAIGVESFTLLVLDSGAAEDGRLLGAAMPPTMVFTLKVVNEREAGEIVAFAKTLAALYCNDFVKLPLATFAVIV